MLPRGGQSTSLRLFGPALGALDCSFLLRVAHSELEVPFQDDSCSAFAHDLLCIGGEDAHKYWFMTAAENWLEVTEHIRARGGSNVVRTHSMSPQELSQAPFTIYFHRQRKGDLVILPPRWLG